MVSRYTNPEMGKVWTLENKFYKMLEVEKAVAKVQGELKIIPKKASYEIRRKANFKVKDILKKEEKTRHDVVAFVECLAESVGKNYGRYVHYGLTSSDVLDTALSLQIREAHGVLKKSFQRLRNSILKKIFENKETLCAGRTHGVHAEPMSFALKLAGYFSEFQRVVKRYERSYHEILFGKLSGAIGAYSLMDEKVEKKVCHLLKLIPEKVATQVIPRDRHADLVFSLSMIGNFLERLSVELRHLQRTEVGEVEEGFKKGQKGSSAMPHKKNPISAENITGLSRILRSYVIASSENIALWHERDISHSSVERVILPGAFILSEYALSRMADLMENLKVKKERMLENMNLSQGELYTSYLLVELVRRGMDRTEAYKLLQDLSHKKIRRKGFKKEKLKGDVFQLEESGEKKKDAFYEDSFKQRVFQNQKIRKYISLKHLEEVFSGARHRKNFIRRIEKLIKEF